MWKRYLFAVVGYGAGAGVGALLGLDVDNAMTLAFFAACALVLLGERGRIVPTADEADRPPSIIAPADGRGKPPEDERRKP